MPFLLDSNIVIPQLQNDTETLKLLERLVQEGVLISVISLMEAYQGVILDPRPDHARSQFHVLLRGIDVIPVSESIALRCTEIRAELQRNGKRVRPRALDLLITATAIEHNLTLVTRNQADYADTSGLTLFNDF